MKFDKQGGIQFKKNRGNPNPSRPMPDSQGEKLSILKETKGNDE